MSGPAALKAEQGNTLKNVRRKLSILNNYKNDNTKEHYGTAEPEISLYINAKILPNKYYKKGSTVHKRSKYKTSSNYFSPKSSNGSRELFSNKNTKDIRQKTEPTRWVLCDKDSLPKSRNRKITHIQPQEKHEILRQQPTRRWATAVLSLFEITTKNYYEPLASFAHYDEIEWQGIRQRATAPCVPE
jgi:hypothetical protein